MSSSEWRRAPGNTCRERSIVSWTSPVGIVFLKTLAGCVEEADVELRVLRHEGMRSAEAEELREHDFDSGLAAHHLVGDAVDARGVRRDRSVGVDEGLESAVLAELAFDDGDGSDLDEDVAAGRVQACRLGVEDDEDFGSLVRCGRHGRIFPRLRRGRE